MKNRLKKLLSNVLFPAMALVAIVGIIAFRMVFTPMIIQTGSMVPTLPVGATVFVQHTDTLKPTDIITFKQSTDVRATTHTFIGYDDDGSLKTKGDANATPDVRAVPLQMSDVQGKVMFTLLFTAPSFWVTIQGVLVLIVIALMIGAFIVVYVKDRRGSQMDNKPQREDTLEPTPV